MADSKQKGVWGQLKDAFRRKQVQVNGTRDCVRAASLVGNWFTGWQNKKPFELLVDAASVGCTILLLNNAQEWKSFLAALFLLLKELGLISLLGDISKLTETGTVSDYIDTAKQIQRMKGLDTDQTKTALSVLLTLAGALVFGAVPGGHMTKFISLAALTGARDGITRGADRLIGWLTVQVQKLWDWARGNKPSADDDGAHSVIYGTTCASFLLEVSEFGLNNPTVTSENKKQYERMNEQLKERLAWCESHGKEGYTRDLRAASTHITSLLMLAGMTVRPLPSVIYLHGPAGCGKTTLAAALCNTLAKELKMDQTHDRGAFVYKRDSNSKFWDGYNGQAVVWYDDVLNGTNKNKTEWASEIIEVINTAPFVTRQAIAEEKGMVPLKVRYVIITSNHLPENNLGVDQFALLRRLHLMVYCYKNPIYKVGSLDPFTATEMIKMDTDGSILMVDEDTPCTCKARCITGIYRDWVTGPKHVDLTKATLQPMVNAIPFVDKTNIALDHKLAKSTVTVDDKIDGYNDQTFGGADGGSLPTFTTRNGDDIVSFFSPQGGGADCDYDLRRRGGKQGGKKKDKKKNDDFISFKGMEYDSDSDDEDDGINVIIDNSRLTVDDFARRNMSEVVNSAVLGRNVIDCLSEEVRGMVIDKTPDIAALPDNTIVSLFKGSNDSLHYTTHGGMMQVEKIETIGCTGVEGCCGWHRDTATLLHNRFLGPQTTFCSNVCTNPHLDCTRAAAVISGHEQVFCALLKKVATGKVRWASVDQGVPGTKIYARYALSRKIIPALRLPQQADDVDIFDIDLKITFHWYAGYGDKTIWEQLKSRAVSWGKWIAENYPIALIGVATLSGLAVMISFAASFLTWLLKGCGMFQNKLPTIVEGKHGTDIHIPAEQDQLKRFVVGSFSQYKCPICGEKGCLECSAKGNWGDMMDEEDPLDEYVVEKQEKHPADCPCMKCYDERRSAYLAKRSKKRIQVKGAPESVVAKTTGGIWGLSVQGVTGSMMNCVQIDSNTVLAPWHAFHATKSSYSARFFRERSINGRMVMESRTEIFTPGVNMASNRDQDLVLLRTKTLPAMRTLRHYIRDTMDLGKKFYLMHNNPTTVYAETSVIEAVRNPVIVEKAFGVGPMSEVITMKLKVLEVDVDSIISDGDCGSLIVSDMDTFTIHGHLVGGSGHINGNAQCALWTKHSILQLEAQLEKTPVSSKEVPVHELKGLFGDPESSLVPSGGVSYTHVSKTAYVSSPFRQDAERAFGDAPRLPAQQNVAALAKAMSKWKEPQMKHFNAPAYDKAIKAVKYEAAKLSLTDTIVTFKEGVLGAYGSSKMDRHTSCGYGWDGCKSDYINFDTGECAEELITKTSDLLDVYEEMQVPHTVFKASLKDEKRDRERVKAGKTRIIFASPLHKTLADRMIFMQLIEKSKILSWFAPGVNPTSKDWSDIANRHMSCSSNKEGHFSVDYSGFDSTQSGGVAVDIIAAIFDQTPKLKKLAMASTLDSFKSDLEVYGVRYYKSTGMPSGCAMTTCGNTWYNMFLNAYAFYCSFPEKNYREFCNEHIFTAYGDDVVVTSPIKVDDFCSSVEVFGTVATSALKTEEIEKGPIEAVVFLGRSFARSAEFGAVVWMAPLSFDTVIASLYFEQNGSRLEERINTLRNVLVAAASHDARTYNKMVTFVNKALVSIGASVNVMSPQQIREEVGSGYFVSHKKKKLPTRRVAQKTLNLTEVLKFRGLDSQENKPKMSATTVKCNMCGCNVKKTRLTTHNAICPMRKKKQQQAPKKNPQGARPPPKGQKKQQQRKAPNMGGRPLAGTNGRQYVSYSGRSVLGHLSACADEYNCPMIVAANPAILAARAKDPLLTRATEQWSRFMVEQFDMVLVPVAGPSAVVGTTAHVGKWDNVNEPTGPTDINVAVKTSTPIPIGTNGMSRGGSRTDRLYNIHNGNDMAENVPYFMYAAQFGKTTSVYRADQEWTGPLWEVHIHYRFIFDGPSDGARSGSLLSVPINGSTAELVEKRGQPVFLRVSNRALVNAVFGQASDRSKNGFLDFLRKAVGIIADAAAAGSAFLPPPWDFIIGGGAMIVRAIVGDANDESVSFHVYNSVANGVGGDPITGRTDRTIKLALGPGGHYQQLTDPNENVYDGGAPAPEPVDPADRMYATFGKPGDGQYVSPPHKSLTACPVVNFSLTEPGLKAVVVRNDGPLADALSGNILMRTVTVNGLEGGFLVEERDASGAVVARFDNKAYDSAIAADDGLWNCTVDGNKALASFSVDPTGVDTTAQAYTPAGNAVFVYAPGVALYVVLPPGQYVQTFKMFPHKEAADEIDGFFKLRVSSPALGEASLEMKARNPFFRKTKQDMENDMLRQQIEWLRKELYYGTDDQDEMPDLEDDEDLDVPE